MWFEPMFQFVDQDHCALSGRLPLKTGDEQPRRTGAKAAQRNGVLVVKRNGSTAEGHRAGIEQRSDTFSDGDAKLFGGGGHDPKGLAKLLLHLVPERSSGVTRRSCQGSGRVGAFFRNASTGAVLFG